MCVCICEDTTAAPLGAAPCASMVVFSLSFWCSTVCFDPTGHDQHARHCHILLRTATLQHGARMKKHRDSMIIQHAATLRKNTVTLNDIATNSKTTAHCNTLQHTATHCNTAILRYNTESLDDHASNNNCTRASLFSGPLLCFITVALVSFSKQDLPYWVAKTHRMP